MSYWWFLNISRREEWIRWKETLKIYNTVSPKEVKDVFQGRYLNKYVSQISAGNPSPEAGCRRTGQWLQLLMMWYNSKRPTCPENWLRWWTVIETKALLLLPLCPSLGVMSLFKENAPLWFHLGVSVLSLLLMSSVHFQLIFAGWIDHLCIARTQYKTDTMQGRSAYSGTLFQRDSRRSLQGKQRRVPLSALLEWDWDRFIRQPIRKQRAQGWTRPVPSNHFNKKSLFKVYQEYNFIKKQYGFYKGTQDIRHVLHMGIKCIKRLWNSVGEMKIQTTRRSSHA